MSSRIYHSTTSQQGAGVNNTSGIKKTFCTHGGPIFHADEVVGYAILSGIYELELVRTRDEDLINAADFVVDVGLVYDNERGRYDHHQTPAPLRRDNKLFASAGLVWRHFGALFVQQLKNLGTMDATNYATIAEYIDNTIIADVDAEDNGAQALCKFSFSKAIRQFNISWDDCAPADREVEILRSFVKAADFARGVLIRACQNKAASIRAREQIEKKAAPLGDKAMVLPRFIPYMGTPEAAAWESAGRKVVTWQDKNGWVVCGLSKNKITAVEAANKIKDVLFVHRDGFMGTATTTEARDALITMFE